MWHRGGYPGWPGELAWESRSAAGRLGPEVQNYAGQRSLIGPSRRARCVWAHTAGVGGQHALGLEDDPAGDAAGGLHAVRLDRLRERIHRADLRTQVPLVDQAGELG